MTGREQLNLPGNHDEWHPLWMAPEPFRLPVGRLVDLSVDPATELLLRRSRYCAVVQVGLPDWFTHDQELGLSNFVDAHLKGRDPMTGTHKDGLLVTFAVLDGSDESNRLASQFAESFTSEEVFGPAARFGLTSGVVHVETRDIDHLLPEDMQPLG